MLAIRLRALGDVVLITPALRALRRGFPDARLEVVTEPRYAPLLEGLDGVDRVWPLDRTTGALVRLAASLRRLRIERAVDFFGNPRSATLTALSGARFTAGYALRARRHAYRTRVPRTLALPGGHREHASATHVRLAVAAGGVADGLEPRVSTSASARAAAAALLAAAGVRAPARTVGLVAAGSWPTKTWPVSHVAALARRVLAAGWHVLVLGGPGEDAIASAIASLTPGVMTLGACDVAVLAAVIARLAAVAGTDSGPRHLAAALGVASFAWFGPTHPDTWNPPGERHGFVQTDLPCRACDRTVCPHWNCMPTLAPDVAARHLLAHLERHGPAAGLDPAHRA